MYDPTETTAFADALLPAHQALRALGAKWRKIIFAMWQRQVPYDEQYHLATDDAPGVAATSERKNRLTRPPNSNASFAKPGGA